jgi:Tol biopolymer transport system component
LVFRGGSPGEPARQTSPPSTPTPVSRPAARANGALTIIGGQGISAIGPDARLIPLFSCRSTPGCIDLQSIAWSPDGRRLAFSVTGVGTGSGYLGVHVYDPATHRDRQISYVDGFSLAWSPDGSRIAYVVSSWFARPWGTIYVMNADGSHWRALETGSSGVDMSPSWSADGRRIVFATASVDWDSGALHDSVISIVDLDGSHRRLLVRHASAPAWSPDGITIAYRARCGGIKLMTPAGRDVTLASTELGCAATAIRGGPVWSPDGRELAVANTLGVFLIDLRSPARGAELVTAFGARETGLGMFRTARPSWRAAQ